MAKVLLDMAVSLDGFVGAPGGVDVGLYDWYVNPSEVSRPVIDELIETTGAIVIGRGAYVTGEDSGGWDDTPYRVPHFVITHQPPLQADGSPVPFHYRRHRSRDRRGKGGSGRALCNHRRRS
jgi:hypothetical protein